MTETQVFPLFLAGHVCFYFVQKSPRSHASLESRAETVEGRNRHSRMFLWVTTPFLSFESPPHALNNPLTQNVTTKQGCRVDMADKTLSKLKQIVV